MSFDNWWAPDLTFFDAMSLGLILIAEKLRLTQYGSGQSTTDFINVSAFSRHQRCSIDLKDFSICQDFYRDISGRIYDFSIATEIFLDVSTISPLLTQPIIVPLCTSDP